MAGAVQQPSNQTTLLTGGGMTGGTPTTHRSAAATDASDACQAAGAAPRATFSPAAAINAAPADRPGHQAGASMIRLWHALMSAPSRLSGEAGQRSQ